MSFEINYEEDLVPRIRDLIDGYSKNSILKEYLQNADDSGATELIVTFDKRKHEKLEGSKFEAANEVSLLLYNNAKFKESDFRAIVKISAQGKIEDAGSTGRFGQGFSSSFSISDHPSFVSNGKAYWFDILRNAVSKHKNKSIQGWDIENDKQEIFHWLKTFNIERDFLGTTFRLPLRNTETSSQSNISHEVFKYQDFLEWCDEWKLNTSGLIFLRNVQRLVLQEINESGKLIIHLELSTQNSKEIKEYGKNLQKGFSSGLLKICETWKEHDEALPYFSYKHVFLIRYYNRKNNEYCDIEESWAVVNGLFRGNNDNLIDHAIKVLNIAPNPRKVLPWAGVAISLDGKGDVNKKNKSNYYTFLPLPIKSKHPVHIHGWFDLNPKRTEITYDGSGEDKNILIEWNRLLFKEGVGTAWAHLLDSIKETCDPQRYYSLWPKNNNDEFDEYVLEGFYKEITKHQSFKTKHKKEERWETPKDDIYYLNRSSKDKIFEAFKEHFRIISPKPPQRIIQGLRTTGTDLTEITPKFVRVYLKILSEELNFPIALQDITIEMLAKKDWFLSILQFCAESNEYKDYRLLKGLPLELTYDSNITCLEENRLLDHNPKLRIFENDESVFLHPEVLEIVYGATFLPSTWLRPNLKNYLTVLRDYIYGFDRNSKPWLESLISLIVKADENEIRDAINILHDLEIVYQHDGKFSRLKVNNSSPFLIKKEDAPNIGFLINSGLSLIHPDYIHIYNPLLKYNEYKLITILTPFSLSRHLLNLSLDEYGFFTDRETREYLIDYMSQDISWMDTLSIQEKSRLYDMPFIATESDNIYAKSSGKKLFLPAGFQPPKHIHTLQGEYEIISIINDNQHEMFGKMEFDEQDPINYLKQIIIPYILNLPSIDDVRSISEWLAKNWEEIIQNLNDSQKCDLITSLSESKIIIDGDCSLDAAKSYYHPDFFYKLPNILRDKNYLPFVFDNDFAQKKWSDFLAMLGAAKKIIPEHIVNTVHSLVKDDDDTNSIELINYISNHFELFEKMDYDGENIFKHLSGEAWVPAEKPKSNFLIPELKYKKLRNASELILKNDFMIAGGAHYSLSFKAKLGKKDEDGEFSERDIAKSIGILVDLPQNSIFTSFRRLRNNSSNNAESKVSRFAKEFYKYLGRSHIKEGDIPYDVTAQSVYIKGKWMPSSRVFQTSINLSGVYSWDELIANDGKQSNLAFGLIKLGVSKEPDIGYLITYLTELPHNIKLNKQELKDAKAIIAQLQNNLDELPAHLGAMPLLTRSDQLRTCDQLYIKDISAYDKAKNKNNRLEFCQQQYEKIAKVCGVISLAENITPEVDIDNSQIFNTSENNWESYIRSNTFKTAVLRLIYHEGKINDDEIRQDSIDNVLPSNVLLMDSLVVRYFIDDTWIYDDVETPTYQDMGNSTLYLLNQEDEEDICESIAKFISDSSDLKRDSFSLIGRILRHKYTSTKKVHDLLDNKNIKSLPEKIEINEQHSLFAPENEADEPKYNNETSTYNKSNNDQKLIDDENSVKENIVNDSLNIPTEKKNDNLKGGEVPLPTQPKKSTSTYNSLDDDQKLVDDNHSSKDNIEQVRSRSPSKKKRSNQAGSEIPPPSKPKKSRSTKNIKGKEVSNENLKESSKKHSNRKHSTGDERKVLSLNSTKKIVSSNDRRPVYVNKDQERLDLKTREQRVRATEIGNRGEQYVLDHYANYVMSESNRFEKAPTNNEGFDILEIDSNSAIVRYIEVKTLTGLWGDGGVGVTVPQLEFSQVYDNWWLFVVENINTNDAVVHILENPVQQATSFMFDGSWKQLTKTAKNTKIASPKKGDRFKFDSNEYEVCDVEPKGRFFKVRLKETQTGKELTKKYDPSWEKC